MGCITISMSTCYGVSDERRRLFDQWRYSPHAGWQPAVALKWLQPASVQQAKLKHKNVPPLGASQKPKMTADDEQE